MSTLQSLITLALSRKASKSKLSGSSEDKAISISSKAQLTRQCPFALFSALVSADLTVKVPAPALGELTFSDSLTFSDHAEKVGPALRAVFGPVPGEPDIGPDSSPEVIREYNDTLSFLAVYALAVDRERGEAREKAARIFLQAYHYGAARQRIATERARLEREEREAREAKERAEREAREAEAARLLAEKEAREKAEREEQASKELETARNNGHNRMAGTNGKRKVK